MAERLSRVQRRRRETQERIFRAAMDLFRRQGFERTTIAEIAEAADIGKGTFFTYFPTKEAVFGHLGRMLTDDMARVAGGLREPMPVATVLARLFAGAARWHEANRDLSRQVILAGLQNDFALAADAPNQRRMLSLLTDLVRAGQERGEFGAAIHPGDAATALVGVYFATLLAWVRDADPRPLTQRLQAALDLLLPGLRP